MPSGLPFNDEYIIRRICYLLRTTQMTMPQIGKRFGLSKAVVVRVNNEYQNRQYRSHFDWTIHAGADTRIPA